MDRDAALSVDSLILFFRALPDLVLTAGDGAGVPTTG
jgi:hypothetical protein